jgi:hypothetical protein
VDTTTEFKAINNKSLTTTTTTTKATSKPLICLFPKISSKKVLMALLSQTCTTMNSTAIMDLMAVEVTVEMTAPWTKPATLTLRIPIKNPAIQIAIVFTLAASIKRKMVILCPNTCNIS